MTFYEVLAQVLDWLQRDGRVSYRALKRQFGLDDAYIEDLKIEIIQAKKVAVDEDGAVLVWTGGPAAAPTLPQGHEPAAAVSRADQAQPMPVSRPTPPAPPRQASADQAPQSAALSTEANGPAAERRQLTVLFCDVVDSTRLASKLDPEDYREVIRMYQAVSAEVIQRFEGTIAQYLGDGLLVYFGYPQAHEDDAQRAVRAGLGIIAALATPKVHLAQEKGVRLAVRLGIHTGLVEVGEIGGSGRHERLALGQTPNIAARLQGLAEPDTVVVSAATQRLIQGYFACHDLGAHTLKGLAAPMSVYRVLGESGAQNRFEVAMAKGLTPLVGRQAELERLLRLWAQVDAGQGQAVLLRGDAGIGKSRLTQAFTEHTTRAECTRLRFRCLPHYQHSALYPVIDYLQQAFQLHREEAAPMQLDQLEQGLEAYSFPLPDVMPLFASLLSVPLSERYPPMNLSPQRQKQKTLETLLAWFLMQAEQQPVFMVWEDLHWADPSTLELLGLLLDAMPTARILMLLTCRPQFQLPWLARPHMTQMTLSRLSPTQVEAMVTQLAGGKTLPAEVVRQIVAKTDGVPLFVEELTKMVLESGLLQEENGRYVTSESRAPLPLSIPATLQDSLMARLDRLVTAKGVAQLAATLGREFSYELLLALSFMDEKVLQQGLRRLVEAEFVYQSSAGPWATYIFKHALIRDVAYQSLLKSTRRQYHRRIAQVLTEQFPALVETQPELLAHHYTEAEMASEAIIYWQRAGQRALQQSSNMEALGHLTAGLALLETLPDTPERPRYELTLQLLLGSALIAAKGYAAPEVEQAYTRARTLREQIGEVSRLLQVFLGLEAYYVVRAELRMAYELAQQCLQLAQQVQNPARLLNSHHALGLSLFHLGEPAAALTHLEQGMLLYDAQQHRPHHNLQNPGVACRSYAAWALWHLGYPEQARTRLHEALTLARGVSHPYTMAYGLCFAAGLYQYLREAPTTQETAEEAIAITTEHGFPFWFAMGTCLYGWAQATQGQREEGIVQIRRGIAAWQATGAELAQPHWLALLAETYGYVGQVEAGLEVLADALGRVNKHGERYCEAELYRLEGELLLRQPIPAVQAAESRFQQAMDIGCRHQARLPQLRAGVSLGRLWQHQGKHDAARQLLAELYGWFTEGFATADLQEARALLEKWS